MILAVLPELQQARRDVPMFSVWTHKKGGTYRVVGHSFDTEALTPVVHYRRIAGPNFNHELEQYLIWSRPVAMFKEPDRFKEVSG